MWGSQCTSNCTDLGHPINIIPFTLDVLFSAKKSTEGARDLVVGADSFWRARVDLASAEQSQCS